MCQTMASSYHAGMPKEADVKTFITIADKKNYPDEIADVARAERAQVGHAEPAASPQSIVAAMPL